MKQFSHCYVQVKLGDAISTFWEQLPEARGACERLYTLFPNLLQWTGLCAPLYWKFSSYDSNADDDVDDLRAHLRRVHS